MVRFLIRLGVSLLLAALALFIASLLVPGMHLHVSGFLVAIIVFAAVQALLEWLVETLFHRGAPAVAGVAGLISTAIALFVASLGDGITFDGVAPWVLAAVIVWIITALAAWLSGKYLLPRIAPAKPAK
ncbi:phage holin family protein [Agromyces endophyticus]|uniref:phage holin family protein n=1 Tax=Agromyces sp. H17E-10 TaxID=2932244 RepID=UPI001FD284C9|nr:phage holin family protein [Agromyces sp. H17E-10]UOQ87678.1 phage holin family protein [Agromyces sp. H17E-10]